MHRIPLPLIALLAVLLAPAAPRAAAPTAEELARNIEWFGMNLGIGPLIFNPGAEDPYAVSFVFPAVQADLLLFNLNFRHAYLTPLELHPVFFLGYLGGGLRAGGRIPLSADRRHELRLGSFAGCDYYLFHINAFHPALSLKPHLQYIYHTSLGSIGVGLDLLLLFHFRDEMTGGDGYTFDVPPVAYGASLYFRWTIGRSAL